MKQKLISKLKRVALAFFAALCVGNVWAATFAGDIQNLSFEAETKTISFKWNCYLYDTVNSYKVKAILEYGGSTVTEKVTTKEFVSGRWYVMKFDKTLDDFNLGDVLRVTFSLCYGNSDANVDNTWGDDSFTYTIDTRGVLTSECLWDVDTKKFLLSGKVAGDGIKGVKVKYKISDAELAELPEDAVVENAEFDSVASTYKIQIPYVNEKSYLNWSVYAVFDDEEKIFKDPSTEKEVLSDRQDEDGYIAYTWVGNEENNLWSSPENWDENLKRSLKGVPGYVNHAGHHTSIACFTNSATVNLGGGTYRLYDYEGNNIPHRALRFIKGDNENMVVKFTNGNLQINDGEDNNSNPLLGADGVTVEFADGGIYQYPYQLAFAPGTTIIFSGNSTQPWKYNPANKGTGDTTFIVKDGTVVSSYGAESVSQTHTAIIQNGTWVIKEPVSKGIANVTKFIDGTSQARLALGDNATSIKTKTLKLTGTFEFTFSENQNSKSAYILPNQLVDGSQNATFKVDATAYKSGTKVPMVEATTATTFIPKLQVIANGVEVTSDRNAKLVWEGNTLYYQQDSLNAASIGATEYATLGAALEAATAGATITILNDCMVNTACVIANKTLTIDLNGKTVKANDTAAATDGNGVFWVQAGGVLTLEDSSEEKTGTVDGNGGNAYKMAIWADGGKVVINGGNYVNENDGPDNQYDLIYVKNGGSVEINGGTFKCQTPNWTLNSHDTAKGTIVVKGGTFYQFNPANCTTEGANTNFCADGLCGYVVETVDGVDVYGVAAAVATIGEAKFVSLDAAIAAAGADDEVLVVADIATDAAFEITKTVAVNLNGKTIATTQADTEGNGVFWVKAGGELTLNGEGTVNGVGGNAYNIAIWADGGKVIINGGTYTNEGAQDDGPDGAHFDLIYVKNGGAVEINGGTFKCQTPEWTLNSHDTKKGTIVVNGGLFYQFNPSDCATEGAGTNWCAEGLKGAESVENAGYYEIVDAWTAPLPDLEEGDSFSGDYEYTSEVLSALEAKAATSVDVKVNGVELKGDEAIKALNTAVASFDDALTFDGTAAILDIEIKVTAVNTEDPAASTVVVKRGETVLSVKTGVKPTVKYFYPETKTWGSDKPESGAVLFKLVF